MWDTPLVEAKVADEFFEAVAFPFDCNSLVGRQLPVLIVQFRIRRLITRGTLMFINSVILT